jgi:hypothetical protein
MSGQVMTQDQVRLLSWMLTAAKHCNGKLSYLIFQSFNKDYKSLETNTAKPMFNRAISGAYEPGSTLKCLLHLPGLERSNKY